MSGQSYDVIIVGAGPAGSYIAYELASSGHGVAVFEEKGASGLNICCTGIISTECFQSLDLGKDMILTEVKSVKFYSPSGRCLKFQTDNVQACVVDRLLLDKALASKAQAQGAQYFFSSPVIDIVPGKDSIQVETSCSGAREIFSARAVVLANGFTPKLPHKLGLGRIKRFLIGAQAEIEAKDIDEFEVYFGQGIAPGAFAWLVPISANKAYVGLLATSQAKLYLQKFLDSLFSQGRITSRDVEIRQRAVPIGTLTRSYGDRLLVIGDAAGQVKPTTGGGIYFGHLGARIAAEVLDGALSNDSLTADQLSRYQKKWRAKMDRELSHGYWARWVYSKLSDRQIEGIFNILNSDGMTETLLNSGNFSFDWHSRLVSAILRRSSAYPLLKIRHLIFREASL
ncbi:MAG: NAD(P)/FAD-dependent oxidoreductase [Dehalococcoidia bacterium]|nr:NAD(P)/FAD-dependent oxidoreductase [Dehalococcoidia bacterium]MDH4291309.1 NAD(P)/FAD-dependent oxidoreductase [Dehalococcoidia bacterium]